MRRPSGTCRPRRCAVPWVFAAIAASVAGPVRAAPTTRLRSVFAGRASAPNLIRNREKGRPDGRPSGSRSAVFLGEEIAEVDRARRRRGRGGPQRVAHRAGDRRVLVVDGRLVVGGLQVGRRDDHGDAAAAGAGAAARAVVRDIGAAGIGEAREAPLVEPDDQQAVAARLEIARAQQRADVRLQPGIGRGEAAVVGIVTTVGDDQ